MMRGYEQHHIDGDRVYRFVRIERLQHWVNAVSFFLLALTGLVMLSRRMLSLPPDKLNFFHQCHLYTGALYFFGPALVFLIGDWKKGLQWMGNAFRWTFTEFLWLMGPARKLLFRRRSPPVVGRFNAGQRLNMLGQIVGKWLLAFTGYYMQFETGRLLFYYIHVVVFAFLAVLVAGHVYLGLVNRSTRHARFAIWSGFVKLEWLEHHHPGWVEKLPRADGTGTGDPPRKKGKKA